MGSLNINIKPNKNISLPGVAQQPRIRNPHPRPEEIVQPLKAKVEEGFPPLTLGIHWGSFGSKDMKLQECGTLRPSFGSTLDVEGHIPRGFKNPNQGRLAQTITVILFSKAQSHHHIGTWTLTD